MVKAKKKRAPPPHKIILTEEHFKTIADLAKVGCSQDEICQRLRSFGFKICRETLIRKMKEREDFRATYDAGVTDFKVDLRSTMWKQAQMMNNAGVHMSRFLAVNYLGMSDKVDHKHSGEVETHVDITSAKDRIAVKLEAIFKRLAGGEVREPAGSIPEVAQITYSGGS